jgi:hypothetical protein
VPQESRSVLINRLAVLQATRPRDDDPLGYGVEWMRKAIDELIVVAIRGLQVNN